MDTVRCPFDVGPFHTCLVKSVVKRDHSSRFEYRADFADRSYVGSKRLVAMCRRRRPNYTRFAKDHGHLWKSIAETFQNLHISLSKFLDRRPTARVLQSMPDVIKSNLYGNELRLMSQDVRLPTSAKILMSDNLRHHLVGRRLLRVAPPASSSAAQAAAIGVMVNAGRRCCMLPVVPEFFMGSWSPGGAF